MAKTNWNFGKDLRRWRRKFRPGVTQEEFAESMGKSRTYMAGLENGNMRAPGMDVCADIAHLLQVGGVKGAPTGEEVWAASAPEKLRASDPDLYAWHQAQVTAARGDETTWQQRWLLKEVEDSAWTCEQLASLLELLNRRTLNLDQVDEIRAAVRLSQVDDDDAEDEQRHWGLDGERVDATHALRLLCGRVNRGGIGVVELVRLTVDSLLQAAHASRAEDYRRERKRRATEGS